MLVVFMALRSIKSGLTIILSTFRSISETFRVVVFPCPPEREPKP